MLIGEYIFVIFLSLFVMRNFRGSCSYNEMLKGYMAGESLGVLVLKPISRTSVTDYKWKCWLL